MATPTSDADTHHEVPIDTRRATRWPSHLAWGIQLLAALLLLAAAAPKLAGSELAVETFDEIGAGQWLRVLTGVVEVAGAIGLLIPQIAGLAACCLVALMILATATNVVLLDDAGAAVTTIVLLAAFGYVAWRRLPELNLRALAGLGRRSGTSPRATNPRPDTSNPTRPE